MRPIIAGDDRGASLVEYALLVVLVAVGGLVAVTSVGNMTSQSFDDVSTAIATGELADDEMTPEEKWEKAQEDYDKAVADAKAKGKAEKAEAKAAYDAAKAENKSLPKDERKSANAAAKAEYKSATSAATHEYKTSLKAAKDTKASAKAEYKASK